MSNSFLTTIDLIVDVDYYDIDDCQVVHCMDYSARLDGNAPLSETAYTAAREALKAHNLLLVRVEYANPRADLWTGTCGSSGSVRMKCVVAPLIGELPTMVR